MELDMKRERQNVKSKSVATMVDGHVIDEREPRQCVKIMMWTARAEAFGFCPGSNSLILPAR